MARQHDQEHTEVVRGATGRPVVRGTHGIVASGHYLTSMAGMRMLLSGGNAFDAAVAMGFAAAVIEPTASYSLATEGVGMLYHAASGTMQALSGQGVAPQAATVAGVPGPWSHENSHRSRRPGASFFYRAWDCRWLFQTPGDLWH